MFLYIIYYLKGEKMHWFEYKEVVEKVEGLNSVSTLKKWRLKIENLTSYSFKESRVKTGKSSYSKIYLFNDDEVYKFQMIADLKTEIGLNNAILKVYAPSRASPKTIEIQLKELSSRVNYLSDSLENVINKQHSFDLQLNITKKQISSLESPKKRRLFGK